MKVIHLLYDEDSDTWTGLAIDKPGIVSQADSAAEALADLWDAEIDYDEAMQPDKDKNRQASGARKYATLIYKRPVVT